MLLPLAAIVVGLALLAWSADQFIEGAAAIAIHLVVSSFTSGCRNYIAILRPAPLFIKGPTLTDWHKRHSTTGHFCYLPVKFVL